ncbi:MAG: type I DNA topoisomerase [Erysipelotrichaceae bacterium]|nr:type I DNA topoisomerase [Erysipelotrichaceae bacterium]
MSKLVIVESPSKAKTIEKYLGKGYQVVSSKGHIRDLATSGKGGLGVDVDNDFKPTYIDSPDKKDVIEDLEKKIKKADSVYLATDPDREGEAIAWHIANRFDLSLDDNNRVVFNEITKPVVTEAIGHPSKVDMQMVYSQEARRILDRIIGFKLSNLLKSKIKSKSAGRVQSVALKLIVDREDEIKAFVPEEYWSVTALFKEDKKNFKSKLSKINDVKLGDKDIKTEADAQKIKDKCLEGPFTVAAVDEHIKAHKPNPPYTTSKLQQDAATKLYFTSKKTMQVAQRLYEGISISTGLTGLITYMRTDSVRMSDVFLAQGYRYIVENYGKEYAGYYKAKTGKNAQDAHEAIRPTSIENTPESIKEYLTNDEYKLYRLIYYRALAAMMADAKYRHKTITLKNDIYEFVTTGQTQVFDGYQKVYGEFEKNTEDELPEMKKDQQLTARDIETKQHFTEPKPRYTEARLIEEMERNGIGRPSTYATIIDTIQQREYVTLEKSSEGGRTRVFVPTEQGVLTTRKLDEFFSSIINTTYTAKMETELDKIAEGKADHVKELKKFYKDFMPLMDKAYADMEKLAPQATGEICPLCGGELVIRTGRYGKFISCSNFPSCKYTSNMPKEAPEETGEACPECGSPLVRRKNRYGQTFVGCSNYPTCKYIKSDGSAPRRFFRRKGSYAKKS